MDVATFGYGGLNPTPKLWERKNGVVPFCVPPTFVISVHPKLWAKEYHNHHQNNQICNNDNDSSNYDDSSSIFNDDDDEEEDFDFRKGDSFKNTCCATMYNLTSPKRVREFLTGRGYKLIHSVAKTPKYRLYHAQNIETGTLHVIEQLPRNNNTANGNNNNSNVNNNNNNINNQSDFELIIDKLSSPHPYRLNFQSSFVNDKSCFRVSEPLQIIDVVRFIRNDLNNDLKMREELIRLWTSQIIQALVDSLKSGVQILSFSWESVYLDAKMTAKLGGYEFMVCVDKANSIRHLPKRIYRAPECLRSPTPLQELQVLSSKVLAWNLGTTVFELLLNKTIAGHAFEIPPFRVSKQKALRNIRCNLPCLPPVLTRSGLSQFAQSFILSTLAYQHERRWDLNDAYRSEWITTQKDSRAYIELAQQLASGRLPVDHNMYSYSSLSEEIVNDTIKSATVPCKECSTNKQDEDDGDSLTIVYPETTITEFIVEEFDCSEQWAMFNFAFMELENYLSFSNDNKDVELSIGSNSYDFSIGKLETTLCNIKDIVVMDDLDHIDRLIEKAEHLKEAISTLNSSHLYLDQLEQSVNHWMKSTTDENS